MLDLEELLKERLSAVVQEKEKLHPQSEGSHYLYGVSDTITWILDEIEKNRDEESYEKF